MRGEGFYGTPLARSESRSLLSVCEIYKMFMIQLCSHKGDGG